MTGNKATVLSIQLSSLPAVRCRMLRIEEATNAPSKHYYRWHRYYQREYAYEEGQLYRRNNRPRSPVYCHVLRQPGSPGHDHDVSTILVHFSGQN
jgi:hypothetical protein